MIRRNQVQGLSLIVSSTLLLIFVARVFSPRISALTQWILLWAGVESLLSFYGLSWGLVRSNRIFFSIFVGGSLVRMVSLGVVTYILVWMHLPPTIPLLSLVAAYFILSLMQFPFLTGRAG